TNLIDCICNIYDHNCIHKAFAFQFAISQVNFRKKKKKKLMEKGKKPIQEEENGFFSLKNYQPNVASSSSEPPLKKFDTVFEQPDSAEGTVVLDATEQTVDNGEEDLFSKSPTTDSVDDSLAGTTKSPVTPSPNPASVTVAQVDKVIMEQIAVQGTVVSAAPPAQLASASVGKPFEHRKAMLPQELENIAKTDPKRAARIMANRRSAKRSKEKQKLYTFTLEHTLKKLKSQAAQTSARLAILGTETKSLIYENSKLKDHAKVAKKMIEKQESKNNDIRKEIQFYKHFLARQMRAAVGGTPINLNINAPSVNALSMAAQQGLNVLTQSTRLHRGLQHGFQQQRAGQARQPQHHQNHYLMRNVQVWPRHVRE
ncbi:transcription factor RF2a-like, partial [Durio zibethinus]|uniref:Transcription factor RF2a-like n=1 Tax=Durio zibethinus TaxID=66656 RepID=A0A6P5XHY9_DURZI